MCLLSVEIPSIQVWHIIPIIEPQDPNNGPARPTNKNYPLAGNRWGILALIGPSVRKWKSCLLIDTYPHDQPIRPPAMPMTELPEVIRKRNQIAPSSLFGPSLHPRKMIIELDSDQPSISAGTDLNSNAFEPSHLLFRLMQAYLFV